MASSAGVYTISGTGISSDTVILYEGTTVLGTATVQNGTWSIQKVTLAGGSNPLTASQAPTPGDVSLLSATYTVIVPVPAAPTVSAASATSPGLYTVSGTGVSGDTITLYDGANVVGTGTVQNGIWSIQQVLLLAGGNSLTATQSAAPGITSAASAPFGRHRGRAGGTGGE